MKGATKTGSDRRRGGRNQRRAQRPTMRPGLRLCTKRENMATSRKRPGKGKRKRQSPRSGKRNRSPGARALLNPGSTHSSAKKRPDPENKKREGLGRARKQGGKQNFRTQNLSRQSQTSAGTERTGVRPRVKLRGGVRGRGTT